MPRDTLLKMQIAHKSDTVAADKKIETLMENLVFVKHLSQ